MVYYELKEKEETPYGCDVKSLTAKAKHRGSYFQEYGYEFHANQGYRARLCLKINKQANKQNKVATESMHFYVRKGKIHEK